MSTPPPNTNNPRSGTEVFRPYARLISVLGDQLITSKWVGVIELVKNSYDADADKVSVRFIGFDEPGQSPYIEIEDDGDGMTLDIVRNVWMRPAAPFKLNKKRSLNQRYTKRGRLMQGDKGVGRFAIYKLGNLVEMFTKTEDTLEVSLLMNFRDYAQNDEFRDEEEFEHKFLDEVQNEWTQNETPEIIKNRKHQGTLIRISDLRNQWKFDDLGKLQAAFQKMIPPIVPNLANKIKRDFDVKVFWDGVEYPRSKMNFEEIIGLAPFSFEGEISSKGVIDYRYVHRTREKTGTVNVFNNEEALEYDIWKLPSFRLQFLEKLDSGDKNHLIKFTKSDGTVVRRKGEYQVKRRPSIGPLRFYFYAFDLGKNGMDLTKDDEEFIKDNSVYLYRDMTRVYPYGERGIDWLQLSKQRAEDRAGSYFSYNDLFGFIFITQAGNPDLRDQASREGLVNKDGAYDDFVALTQAILKVMKDFVDVDKRKDVIKKEKIFETTSSKFQSAFDELSVALQEVNSEKALQKAQNFNKVTKELIAQYKERLTITEDLAGLGMAVEKSSHDIFLLITKLLHNSSDIIKRFEKNKLSGPDLKKFLFDLQQSLEFLYQELQILQPLFRESRKLIRDISVREVFERVARYYKRELQFEINLKIEGNDFIVKTNLGLLLQVFINLIDNAIYWLKQKEQSGKRIIVSLDPIARTVMLSDNGPGIEDDLSEIVFLEFFSRKADSGRGLGLYIAKELLERIDAGISLITIDSSKILPGANFLIEFDKIVDSQ